MFCFVFFFTKLNTNFFFQFVIYIALKLGLLFQFTRLKSHGPKIQNEYDFLGEGQGAHFAAQVFPKTVVEGT